MSHSKELQEVERKGREAGRKECLDFLRKEDEELTRKLEAWLVERGSHGDQVKDMLPTSSINDSLSPDLLFNIFKRLDCIETTRVRRVCKQWFEIIDEHKSFWRTLHLPEKSLEWDPSILELFDQKSNSTLQEIEVRVPVEEEHQEQFFDTLTKSRDTLENLEEDMDQDIDYLSDFLHVESFIVMFWYDTCRILMKRSVNNSTQDRQDTATPLKVLWNYSTQVMLKQDPSRFRNLVSLDAGSGLCSSEWRSFLEGPSQTLKHLRFGFLDMDEENHEGILSLDFPNLKVLELDSDGAYPQWMKIKPSVKLICHGTVSELPAVSEVWSMQLFQEFDLADRCPELQMLRIHEFWSGPESLIRILVQRSKNVKAGAMVGGIQMKRIQMLAIPLLKMESDSVNQLRELVETVVNVDDLPKMVEVEI